MPITVIPGAAAAGGGATTTSGTYASVPASPTAGDLHIATDSPLWQRYDGSAWKPILPGWPGPLTTPSATGWSNKDVSGSPTLTNGVLSNVSSTTAGPGWRYRSAPATPYTVTVVFPPNNRRLIALYESGTTKGIFINWDDTNRRFYVQRDSNLGITFAAHVFFGDAEYNWGRGPIAMRVSDDGTSITFAYSVDGVNYYAAYSEARGTSFTTAPDSIGIPCTASSTKAAPDAIISYEEA